MVGRTAGGQCAAEQYYPRRAVVHYGPMVHAAALCEPRTDEHGPLGPNGSGSAGDASGSGHGGGGGGGGGGSLQERLSTGGLLADVIMHTEEQRERAASSPSGRS